MADNVNRVLVPSGKRINYTPLHRELFWEAKDDTLYIYNQDHWVLLAGKPKQFLIAAGDNLEIVYTEDDIEKLHPILRLKDNVDINTLSLGKNSKTKQWQGMIKLGEVYNSTFFPLIEYSPTTKDLIGGKCLIKIFRENTVEYGIYHVTASAIANGSLFGSDDQNVKCTLQKVIYNNGSIFVGFRTFSTTQKELINDLWETTFIPPTKIEVWFNGWDTRKKIPIVNLSDDNIKSAKVIARN